MPLIPPQSAVSRELALDPSRAWALPSCEWVHRYCRMSCSAATIIRCWVKASWQSWSLSFLYATSISVWWGKNQMFSTLVPSSDSMVRGRRRRTLECNRNHLLKTNSYTTADGLVTQSCETDVLLFPSSTVAIRSHSFNTINTAIMALL